MSNIEKAAVRQAISIKRKSLSENEVTNRSSVIIGKIEVMLEFLKAKTVFIYWSLPEEVQTHDFIRKWMDIKTFVLPQVNSNKLTLRKLSSVDELKKGKKLGIMEPTGELVQDFSSIDLAIVPGVAFDREGNRLGRGKAYYDKILPKLERVYKVGVAFDFQIMKSLPVDNHDVPMDIVISD